VIRSGAVIESGAVIGAGATIGSGARIGIGAVIESEAEIGSRAEIGSGAVIGDRTVIGSGTKPVTICINGSRFQVSYWGEDRIDIGCQSRSIEGWLTNYTDIAKEHNFTIEEIEEYRGYVELIKSVHAKETQKEEAPEGGILAQ
jgi:acyl-[acyl carrier protein]--UDP-N-acetylglucosamine O-acyltransferase